MSLIPLLGVPKMVYTTATAQLLFHGNSLMYGFHVGGTSAAMPAQLQTMAPVNGVLCRNFAFNGATIATLRTHAAQSGGLDTYYVAGKRNILCIWEGTNTPWGNAALTGEDVALQMAVYVAERRAAFAASSAAATGSLYIIVMTTLPRYNTGGSWGTNIAGGNAVLTAYNEYLKANYRAMDIDKVIDVRSTGLFEYTGTTKSAEMAPYFYDDIHLTAEANTLLAAQFLAPAYSRIPKR